MLALTDLRGDVIQTLLRRGAITVELVSYGNVEVALKLRVGDHVFVTDELEDDVGRGTRGVVCTVERISVEKVRVRGLPELDEREILRARIRLKSEGPARVRSASGRDVDVERFTHVLVG